MTMMTSAFCTVESLWESNIELIDAPASSLEHAKLRIMTKSSGMPPHFVGENGKIDAAKLQPITFDPVSHSYLALGEKAGQAFHDGLALKG